MFRLRLSSIVVTVMISVSAGANEVCDAVNRIVASGLDAKRPFAAVAALQLPNADCVTDIEERNYYCAWAFPDLENLRMLRKKFMERLTDSSQEYKATERELKKRLKMATKANRQSFGVLYGALYDCFDKGLVSRAKEYSFRNRREEGSISSSWSRKGGCDIILKEDNPTNKMSIVDDGIVLSVWCDDS